MELTEEQVANLLVGKRVEISVGEPRDFESADGRGVLSGTVEAVHPATPAPQDAPAGADIGDLEVVLLAVTPFDLEGAEGIDRLVAARRYEGHAPIVERPARGEKAHVNLSYAARGPGGIVVDGWMIGGARLAGPTRAEQVGRRGRELYERKIRREVEPEHDAGRLLAVDVETGDYELDDETGSGTDRLLAKGVPAERLYLLRVGHGAVDRLWPRTPAGLRGSPPQAPTTPAWSGERCGGSTGRRPGTTNGGWQPATKRS